MKNGGELRSREADGQDLAGRHTGDDATRRDVDAVDTGSEDRADMVGRGGPNGRVTTEKANGVDGDCMMISSSRLRTIEQLRLVTVRKIPDLTSARGNIAQVRPIGPPPTVPRS